MQKNKEHLDADGQEEASEQEQEGDAVGSPK